MLFEDIRSPDTSDVPLGVPLAGVSRGHRLELIQPFGRPHDVRRAGAIRLTAETVRCWSDVDRARQFGRGADLVDLVAGARMTGGRGVLDPGQVEPTDVVS